MAAGMSTLRTSVAAGVGLALAGTLCVGAAAASNDEGTRLRSLERELNRAIATRDTRRVAEMLTDDWILVTGNGRVKSKADVLAEITVPDLEFQDNETRDVMVRVWGDTAVITGTLHQRYKLRGTQENVTLRYTDTWTRSGDSWRQVSGHASRLPD
jgi:ketosteroid isomerase-like protein